MFPSRTWLTTEDAARLLRFSEGHMRKLIEANQRTDNTLAAPGERPYTYAHTRRTHLNWYRDDRTQ